MGIQVWVVCSNSVGVVRVGCVVYIVGIIMLRAEGECASLQKDLDGAAGSIFLIRA